MSENTCQHQKQHSAWGIGKTHKTYCGKEAKHIDSNGRHLCTEHFNRMNEKNHRRAIRHQLENCGISYSSFLNMLRRNPTHQHYNLFKHKL